MRISSLLLAGTMLLATVAPARADEAEGGLIIVTAAKDKGYRATATGAATHSDTALIDLPQSIAIVTRERLDDQAILSLGDALRYVPGVSVAQGEGNRDEQIIRGVGSNADLFRDGLRDDAQYYRDLYNVEGVEVLKGPNALAFGRGGGGGIINRVTKAPEADAFVAISALADTRGSARGAIDINQPLTANLAARVNGFYEAAESFRDFVGLRRYGVNPVLGWQLSDTSGIAIGYEHDHDDRTADRGVPSLNGAPLPGYRDTFFGVAGVNRAVTTVNLATLRAYHDFSESLSISSKLLYGDYAKSYDNVQPNAPVSNGRASLSSYTNLTDRQNILSQTDLTWKGTTGPITHTIVAGVDVGHQTTRNVRLTGFFPGGATSVSVPLAPVLAIPAPQFLPGTGQRIREGSADSLGLYVQDQISIGDHIELLVGLRHDRFTLNATDQIAGTRFRRTDTLWSPRAGLVIKPLANLSLYANYSRTFLPQSGDQFASLTSVTAGLDPEKFENLEAGVKWNITPGLGFTAAVYQLDRTNTQAAGPTPGTVVLTGASRNKGVELGLGGRITKAWQISAGFAWQDAQIRSGTTAAPAGRRLAQVPHTQFSLWNRYDFTKNFGAGVGIIHQSSSYATISNAVRLPAWTRVDAALFAKLGHGFEAQVNIENLFDTTYFSNADNDNNITPGTPRLARFTLRKRF